MPVSRTCATSPMVSCVPSGSAVRTRAETCSGVRVSAPVRTRDMPDATSPAGVGAAAAAMVAAIWSNVMSCCTRSAMRSWTKVSGADRPVTDSRVTPRAYRRLVRSSAMRPSCSKPTGPEITTSVTASRQARRVTSGSSAPSGRSPAAAMAASTSPVARDMSQPGSNSRVMRALPWLDWLSVRDTPSTAISAGSSTPTTDRSTSSAPAPSQRTATWICWTTVSGKNCALRRGAE